MIQFCENHKIFFILGGLLLYKLVEGCFYGQVGKH